MSSLTSVSTMMVGFWGKDWGEAMGVMTAPCALWRGCAWGCEHAELGLEYMGVEGSVGTVGYIICCMPGWKWPCCLPSCLVSGLKK